MADDAGPLLERAGLIATEQLEIARKARSDRGGTLSEHLVLQGFIDDEELTNFYRQRLMVPRVDPRQLENIPTRVIAKIPKDMADEFRVIPVAIDREQNLIMAMSDPSNIHAVDEIGFFTGSYVVRAVAGQREIARALAKYYHLRTPLMDGTPAEAPPNPGSVRRAVLPPMTSPPSASNQQRAVRVSEIVPALRQAKEDEAKALAAGRFQMGAPTPAAKPSHARTTVKAMPAQGRAKDPAEDDTRPIAKIDLAAEQERAARDLPHAVAGELSSGAGDEHRSEKLAAVIVTAEEPIPQPIVDEAPILLDRKSRKMEVPEASAEAEAAAEAEDVVLLASPKKKPRRRKPAKTRVGVGDFDAAEAAAKLPLKKLTATPDPEPEPRVEAASAPSTTASTASARTRQMPAASDPPLTQSEMREARTAQLPAVTVELPDDGAEPSVIIDESDTTGKFDRSLVPSSVDDGWGEPGSTIPPAFLGAYEAQDASSPLGIPVPDVLDPEEVERKREEAYNGSVRRLSAAMDRLDDVGTRDDVISELISFIASSCKRTAFFSVSRGVLKGWSAAGVGVTTQDLDQAVLPLDQPSTFQDIVATRLPFHGPVHDAVSRDFLLGAVGAAPGDMTALPISVRDKVVGVVFGDDRNQPIFDEHLTTLARCAGAALERIIATRKTMLPG